jgi:hypothetical protein
METVTTQDIDVRLSLDLYRGMLQLRDFELKVQELYRAGMLPGFVHLYVGEEAVAVGVCASLEKKDLVFSTHRGHGHALAKGVPAREVMAELWGKRTGCSGGRGDYDCDGLLDILKTNFSDDLPNLYKNLGKRIFDEQTAAAGLNSYSRLLGWGCGFLDIDNNGWQDIFYVNGHVYPEIDRLNGPAHYREPKVLYKNLGNGKFRDVSDLAGPIIRQSVSGRGCAFGDFNNDGLIDIVINPINDIPELLQCSSQTGNNWIRVILGVTIYIGCSLGERFGCVIWTLSDIELVRCGV